MRKLPLLEALAAHGVLTARAVLAALQLAAEQQDARAAAAIAAALPCSAERSAAEARAAAKLAPDASADPSSSPRHGAHSPTGVLRAKGQCCAACCALDSRDSEGTEYLGGASSDEEPDADLLIPALEALNASPAKGGAASPPLYLPYDAARLPGRHGRLRYFKGASEEDCDGEGGLWAFTDADTERGFRTWHSAKLAKVRAEAGMGAWACLAGRCAHGPCTRLPCCGACANKPAHPPATPLCTPPSARSWTAWSAPPSRSSSVFCCLRRRPRCASSCTCGCSPRWHARRS